LNSIKLFSFNSVKWGYPVGHYVSGGKKTETKYKDNDHHGSYVSTAVPLNMKIFHET